MLSRVNKISGYLNEGEAFIVSGSSNRYYLTGFKSSAGTVLITKTKAYFLIDFRYFEKAKAVVSWCEIILCNVLKTQLQELINKEKIKKIYFETHVLTIKDFYKFKSDYKNIDISSDDFISQKLAEMRSIKDSSEIEKIRKAQEITDFSFSYILNFIGKGKTEIEIALELEFFMRKNGCQGVSFDYIAVSGKNSSLPHGVPQNKKLEKGDFLTIDFGGIFEGYCSDMTRTVVIGEPDDNQLKLYSTVLKAQAEAIKAIKPGIICKDIDKIARDIIDSAGYKGCFGHGLGHSIGIDIHEAPSFNTSCETTLKPGMVITVEPGIYVENTYGVRIEDIIIVTETGCENITKSNKELIIL